jgi:N-acetylglucosamine kinase-like BadF-type ATPase
VTLLLGVDGGNTKTLALVARPDGTIVGMGRSGCADIYGAPSPQDALRALEAAISGALCRAGSSPDALVAAGFSLAGADWPEDFLFLRAQVQAHGWGRSSIIVNDALGALRAGSPSGPVVSVVCGTSLAVGARGPSGETWHGSWWLEGIGSGSLARAALRAVYRAELGIEPPTSLRERALAHFRQTSVEDLLHLLTARDQPTIGIHGLAPAVLDEAEAGDETACTIATAQGRLIGEYALAAARRVGIEGLPFSLVLAGGVLRHRRGLFPQIIADTVRTVNPAVCVVRAPFEPCVGALFLAFDAAGMCVDEHVLARLRASLPASEFFATC